MKKIIILVAIIFVLAGCATVIPPAPPKPIKTILPPGGKTLIIHPKKGLSVADRLRKITVEGIIKKNLKIRQVHRDDCAELKKELDRLKKQVFNNTRNIEDLKMIHINEKVRGRGFGFKPGSWKLNKNLKEYLRSLVPILKNERLKMIIGCADNSPSLGISNKTIAHNRAIAIKNFLEKVGVDTSEAKIMEEIGLGRTFRLISLFN